MSNITKLFILFIFCFSCMSPKKLQQRAEAQKQAFLQKTKDKWQVNEILNVEGAQFTLVHIQQQHYSGIVSRRAYEQLEKEVDSVEIQKIKNIYYKEIRKINKVQKEIYDFLLEVSNKKDFLYVEGKSFPHHYRDRFLAKFIPETIGEISRVLNFKEPFGASFSQPYYFMGASIPIHQDRRMTVMGVENLSLLNLTLSLYENKKLPQADLWGFIQECHEAREGEMVKNMSKNFENLPYRMNSIRFLICGSKHDFKNNVEKWNSENPDKKFNLLVFTPSSIR